MVKSDESTIVKISQIFNAVGAPLIQSVGVGYHVYKNGNLGFSTGSPFQRAKTEPSSGNKNVATINQPKNSNAVALDGQKIPNLTPAFKANPRSLQHTFKHASDFGITANWNKTTAQQFEDAILNHMKGIMPIKGTYRGTQDVLHYFNPSTNVNVMTDMSGNLVGGWKLGPSQINYLQTTGNLK